MKKNELRNGDIVITRDGYVGVVIKTESEEYIMYANESGYDSLDDYNEDMIHEYDPGDPDIMQVYRTDSGICSFMDYDDFEPIYERDYTWIKPSKEQLDARKEERKIAYEKKMEEIMKNREVVRQNNISILAQAFYGNRTGTEIAIDDMDCFILGHLDGKLMEKDRVDRSIINIPGTDNIVLIYNKYQEEKKREYVEELKMKKEYEYKPLAIIPELGLELYSRCIVCRMNVAGEFESLKEDDFDKFIDYLAM